MAAGRFPGASWKEKEAEDEGEREVNGALDQVRKGPSERRRGPDLEEGEGDGDGGDRTPDHPPKRPALSLVALDPSRHNLWIHVPSRGYRAPRLIASRVRRCSSTNVFIEYHERVKADARYFPPAHRGWERGHSEPSYRAWVA